jgi:flavodoxin
MTMNKRIMAFIAVFALCALAANAQQQKKPLIVYFTLPESGGVDAVSGSSRQVVNGQVRGSTVIIAEMIQKQTGGDLFVIETVQTYPGDHRPLLDMTQNEQRQNIHPALKTRISNFSQYDTIFIGYPIWWYTMPMPLYSFFDEYDFAGKTIIPFSTHGGSRLSGTEQVISGLEPRAVMLEGLAVSRNSIMNAERDVTAWLRKLGLNRR